MRAVSYKTFGDANVLNVIDLPKPIPAPQQLLVQVKATALNRADILQRQGKYPPPAGESNILGLEIAGEVVEVGEAITHFKKGDRVCGLVGSGGYAEYCVIDSQTALHIPNGLSFIEAAAIPEAFLTAAEALFTLGQLQPHESILIYAGGSGIGSAAIQLAKYTGATVFTTVSCPEKIKKIKPLGADKMIDYTRTDFAQEIEKLKGVDVIIDFIGARYFTQNLTILKTSGRLICVGMLSGSKTDIDIRPIIQKQLQIKGLIMRARSIEDKRKITQRFANLWLPLFTSKKLYPVFALFSI